MRSKKETNQQVECSTNLLGHVPEELWRVLSIRDRRTDDGEPAEDDGRLMGVLEEDLLRYVEKDREEDEADEGNTNLRPSAQLVEGIYQRAGGVL